MNSNIPGSHPLLPPRQPDNQTAQTAQTAPQTPVNGRKVTPIPPSEKSNRLFSASLKEAIRNSSIFTALKKLTATLVPTAVKNLFFRKPETLAKQPAAAAEKVSAESPLTLAKALSAESSLTDDQKKQLIDNITLICDKVRTAAADTNQNQGLFRKPGFQRDLIRLRETLLSGQPVDKLESEKGTLLSTDPLLLGGVVKALWRDITPIDYKALEKGLEPAELAAVDAGSKLEQPLKEKLRGKIEEQINNKFPDPMPQAVCKKLLSTIAHCYQLASEGSSSEFNKTSVLTSINPSMFVNDTAAQTNDLQELAKKMNQESSKQSKWMQAIFPCVLEWEPASGTTAADAQKTRGAPPPLPPQPAHLKRRPPSVSEGPQPVSEGPQPVSEGPQTVVSGQKRPPYAFVPRPMTTFKKERTTGILDSLFGPKQQNGVYQRTSQGF